MTSPGRGRPFRLAIVAMAMAGCSEELGPVRPNLTRVEGRVTIGGRPAPAGWIELVPTEGTIGPVRSAPIGPDGRFAADGVGVGVNTVGVAHPRFREIPTPLGPVASFEFEPMRTRIRRRIDAIPLTRIVVDLDAEALSLRRKRLSP